MRVIAAKTEDLSSIPDRDPRDGKKKKEQIPTHCLLTSMIRHVPT